MKSVLTSSFSFAIVILSLFSCNKESKPAVQLEYGSVIDIDGNTYQTVKIGDQWWMTENLKTTRFNDGVSILAVNAAGTDSIWKTIDSAAYSVINDSIYGLLYNYYVVSSTQHQVAPAGWHVATDADWKRLEEQAGMSAEETNGTGFRGVNEAEKLVVKNSIGWPESGMLFGTNKLGFSAKPGGCRLFNGLFSDQSNMAFWWTSNAFNANEAWYRYIDSNDKRVFRQHTFVNYGMSIRCVKD